ncbi:MAG: YabP/YqfC family sporulation protein [Oscillospiraceae bacterium]
MGRRRPAPRRTASAGTERVPKKTALARLLELPESTLGGGVHLELNSNREAIIEGCGGVLEYTEHQIRLSGGGMMIKFTGRGLCIGGLDRSGTVVAGQILSIEFIN